MEQEKIYYERECYRSLFCNLSDAILIIEDRTIVRCNNAAVLILGYDSKEELIGRKNVLRPKKQPDGELSLKKAEKIIDLAFKKGRHELEWVHLKKDGSRVYLEVVLARLSDNKKILSVIIRDITEYRQKDKIIKELFIKDSLTGLYNRTYFLNQLNIELNKAHEYKQNLAVLFIDIDGFKNINDNLGHTIGDKVLKVTADRIYKCVGKNHILARIGVDEFGVVLTDIREREEIVTVSEAIINSFKYPIYVEKYEIYITVSIGIAAYPMNGQDQETLMRNADLAMYKAKEISGSSFKFYTSILNEKAKKQFIIENNLRYALERNEFSLHYQPVVKLETGRVVGVEALIRWNHPKYGNIPPDIFIPTAERNGLIGPIGEWVLRTACLDNKRWQKLGYSSIFVAVNISVKQLENKYFMDTVREILKETKLDPKYLELEITESISMENMKNRVDILRELKNLGVGLAIDDFGTGYSSLGQLKKLAISKLKIDRSFINDINIDTDDVAIISTIIAIAKTLNMHVVAEGVETKEQLQILKKQKCDMVQGYFYSPPVPADSFEKFLIDVNFNNC